MLMDGYLNVDGWTSYFPILNIQMVGDGHLNVGDEHLNVR